VQALQPHIPAKKSRSTEEVPALSKEMDRQMITRKDLILLALGAGVCYLGITIAADWMAPPCTDGQPDAHWQAEFNKMEEKYKGVAK